MRKTSNRGIELIQKHEGYRAEAYLCPAGVWTIGYGSTKGVKKGDKITREEAENRLIKDIRDAENEVNKIDGLNQHQFDALVSFVFNLGAGNFQKSTLRKKIIADNQDPSIKYEFEKWVNAGGKKLPGLVARRKDEASLYFATWE